MSIFTENKNTQIGLPLFAGKMVLLVLIIPVIMLAGSIGCGSDNEQEPPDVYFPVQAEPQHMYLQARLEGTLHIEDGTLYVDDSLIIWPFGFTLRTDNDEIWINDETGKAVLRIGDRVRIGGGYIPLFDAEHRIGQRLPDGIDKNAIWMAGQIPDDQPK